MALSSPLPYTPNTSRFSNSLSFCLRKPQSFKLSPSPFKRVSFSSSYCSSPSIFVKAANGTDAAMDAVQKRLMFEDECIIVDENDSILGHVSKYNCHLWENIVKGNSLHRAFSVFLFNSKHELLLQQCSATKVTFPLVWSNTCCSHPLYRESELIEEHFLGVKNAAQRKLSYELGIPAEDAPVDEFTPVARFLYMAPSDKKWESTNDIDVNPNPEEVANVRYFYRHELKELLRKVRCRPRKGLA